MILLTACSGESNPTGTDGPVPTTQVYKSKTSGLTGRRGEVISSQSRWVEVWDQITAGMSPKPALPAVDFDNALLIVGAIGEVGSCSDGRIESVTRVAGALEVSIVEERRPSTCACPAIVVRPVHVVSVPRAATGASFEFRIVNLNSCS
ncbi:MAG: hypothetical protein ACJ74H_14060 [Thermoanaerobaculia bacterium]